MIFKGRARAHGGKLASYLLSAKNEQVRVLDVRGTVIDERSPQGLREALSDMDELGKMTRAKSSLFHLALNPDDRDDLSLDDWRRTIVKAERALGLEEQPRAVVSHIYQGKEHLHVVWSRVNVETRTCVEMSFSHRKLCNAAREIEAELGLHEPPPRAPNAPKIKQRNAEIDAQQEPRAAHSKAERYALIEHAWQNTGSGQAFKTSLEAAGFCLAVGKRGVLLVDQNNETHSVSRALKGVTANEVKEKLADADPLPTIEEVRAEREKAATRQQTVTPERDEPIPATEADHAAFSRRAQQLTVEQIRAELALLKTEPPQAAKQDAEQNFAGKLSELSQVEEGSGELARRVQEMRAQIEAVRCKEALAPEPEPPAQTRQPGGPSL